MRNVYSTGAVPTPPTVPSPALVGYPTPGGVGESATRAGAYWYHMVTSELLAVIEEGGLIPDETNLHQVRDAIAAMIAAAVPTVTPPVAAVMGVATLTSLGSAPAVAGAGITAASRVSQGVYRVTVENPAGKALVATGNAFLAGTIGAGMDTGPAVLSVMPTVISATVVEYRVTALVEGSAGAESQVGGAYDPDALHVVIHGY